MSGDSLDDLIHRADLDGLVRLTDAACRSHDWSQLMAVRTGCRGALHTGRQLWPAATLAEYRLALWAPAEWAAQVLGEDGGRRTIGPLTEVVAQHHTMAELAPLLERGPRLAVIAHERALRGEAIEVDDLHDVFDMPFTVQPWEPAYRLATYSDEGVEAAAPDPPAGPWRRVGSSDAFDLVVDESVTAAFRQLVEPWTASSNGRAEVICVEGDAGSAIAALGAATARSAPIDASVALQWLAWAGASGGAHGRRRGAAVGRFGAWWLLAALGDLTGDWPADPEVLGDVAESLRWSWWTAGEPDAGWKLQLAVDDPDEGYAWVFNAHDAY